MQKYEPLRLTGQFADEVQQQLEIMMAANKQYDENPPLDVERWRKRQQAADAYEKASDWLAAHGIHPYFDHEKGCYVAVPKRGA